MEGVDLETIVQVVTILGGIIALLLALLQIVETYVNIGDKLHKRQLDRKNKMPRQANDRVSFNGNEPNRSHKSSSPE